MGTRKEARMNAPALRTVKVMRRARIRRWMKHLRRSAAMRWTSRVLFAGSMFIAGYFTPRPMELPEVGKPVIVYTSTRVNVAWMDESGTFRSVENGLPMKQVTKWRTP